MKLKLQFFGGRGASGDLGSGDKGAKGAGNVIPITRELHDTADTARKSSIEGFIQAVEDANDSDFNGIGKMLAQMGIGQQMDGTTLAYYEEGGNGIVINEKFADGDADARYDATVQSKYHPSRGNKSGAFAVISHEVGHAATEAAAINVGKTFDNYARDVVKSAARKVGAKTVDSFAKNISGYAQTSNAECLAEAFADVRCNGSNAKKESIAVYNILMRDYNKKKK